MPLVAVHPLPAYARLSAEGFAILSPDDDAPVLRIGLLNMMADAALEATERQILRLLALGAPHTPIALHPFSLPEIPRNDAGIAHVNRWYPTFDDIRTAGLDALFVTGANVPDPDLNRLSFRDAMLEALDWAHNELPSVLYSCLATHAVLGFRYGEPRRALADKCWGVFPHRVVDPTHPLVSGLSANPVVPHSRWNDVGKDQFERAGLKILMTAADGGVHLATSADGRREIYWQGHPEYDPVSLLKEYKREVDRFIAGELDDHPDAPFGIVDGVGADILAEHRGAVVFAMAHHRPPPPFPEEQTTVHLGDAWRSDTVTMMGNWLASLRDGVSDKGS